DQAVMTRRDTLLGATTLAAASALGGGTLVSLAPSLAIAQALPTTGAIDTRLGKLEMINGFPTDATVKKLYDDLDFQRACQGYLWALPCMSMVEWQRQHKDVFGAGNLDYVDYFTFTDKLGILTANATTPYVIGFPNVAESGPLV